MTHSPATSSLGSQFNAFLFASIDEGEAPLSVVSAMARLDLDPWQEAAELARLPRETAAQRLGALLARLPDVPPAHPDARAVALRLIALLPGPAVPAIGVSRPGAGSAASSHIDPNVVMLLFMAMSFIGMAISGLSSHPSRAPANVAHAPAPSATLPTQGSTARPGDQQPPPNTLSNG